MSYKPNNPNGQALMANSEPVVIASNQSAIPVTDNAGSLTVDAPVGTPVFVRLSDGTNAISALPITDNGASITVDGTFWQTTQPVSGTFWQATQPVSGTFWQATQPVSLASVPSHAVTNAGTFAVQAASTQVLGSAATRWYTQISDGTNSPAIKAASIAAITTDPALVVAVSPNNSVTITQATAANLNATVTGTVELGATSLAALENINVTVPGTVDLGTVSLTALETITVTQATASSFLNKPYGSVTTTAPTYTTGTDNALSLTTNGALRVDVMSALPAGSNAIGKLAANDGVDIGDVTINNASIAVTGSFWQATQPVSIATMPSTPVTGTFWQATQPVSGPLTDTQLRAAAVPVSLASVPTHGVTGTFWQATQPVSIATMPSTPVTGTFWQATQPVSIASVPSHPVTNAGTFAVQATQSGTWTVQPGNTANTTPWLVKPAESLGTATALGALNAEVTHALGGNLGAAVTITATATPAGIILTPYASYDGGTNWTLTQFFNSVNGDAISTLNSFAVGAAYSLSAGDGATHVKVRATSWTSGSVTLRISSTNSQGLVNLKASSVHDEAAGSFVLQMGAVASSTAPTAVSANGDAVRLWATPSGALNIADGGGSVTVDGTFWQATQPVSIATMPSTPVTGTFWQTTQPVSGTVAATQSGTWTVGLSASQTLGTVTNLSQLGGTAISMNTGTRDAGTQRVTIATNDSVPVTGTVELGATSLAALENISITVPGTVDLGTVSLSALETISVTGTFWQATQPVSLAALPALPTGANVIGAVTQSGTWNIGTVTTLSQLGGQAINLGAGTTGTGTLRTIEASSATGTQTNPSLSTTSATLLAANTNRRGASVFNNSTAIVYIRLSATAASATTFTIKLQPDDYYEVPSNYNGAITAILNTGTTTAVQVTEIT